MKPLIEISSDQMLNQDYSLVALRYLLGQVRIQLIKNKTFDIVREMCTYNRVTALDTMIKISLDPNPEEFCRGLERPWNCEYMGGRIRLDSQAHA